MWLGPKYTSEQHGPPLTAGGATKPQMKKAVAGMTTASIVEYQNFDDPARRQKGSKPEPLVLPGYSFAEFGRS